jgi:hypothetical protein
MKMNANLKKLAVCLLLAACLLPGCQSQPLPVAPYKTALPSTPMPTWTPMADQYLNRLTYTPEQAQYYDLVAQTFELTPEEKAMLAQNGFVVSDRLAFDDFTTAYGYIYWKDMPVLITTDSILQSIYRSYGDILMEVESEVLRRQLELYLDRARQQVRQDAQANTDPDLKALYADLELYLTVPLALLQTDAYDGEDATGSVRLDFDTPGLDKYLELAGQARTVAKINLFSPTREIDFTLFKPRGHYIESALLGRYFRAMMWLGQIDFRMVTYDPRTSRPTLQQKPIAAAILLRDTLEHANLRTEWDQLDALLSALVGRSDNVTLAGLELFMKDAGITSAAQALRADKAQLLQLLTTNDYGWQRVTGQVVYRHVENPSTEAMPNPVSFALMGQRTVLDAYWMSNLVYDRLFVNGQPVVRAMSNPLDVMYVLGNDRAAALLQSELEQYHYQDNLSVLRSTTDNLPATFWQETVYASWLGLLRALNTPTPEAEYPQSMRTAAWADKVLQTQLASWAQLRHENVLYVKEPYTYVMVLCQYPAGYVEPYPEFFAAVGEYAQVGLAMVDVLAKMETTDENGRYIVSMGENLTVYYTRLANVAAQLQRMAEKELRLEPFTEEEVVFLKSVVVRQEDMSGNCGEPPYQDKWDGWYMKLFWARDKSPAMIVDVQTNPNNDPDSPLYPPGVLHVGVGPVATLLFIADTDEGPTLYVGPAFTYFETVEFGWPPTRLTDLEWEARLASSTYPQPPAWTGSFRLPVPSRPTFMWVP